MIDAVFQSLEQKLWQRGEIAPFLFLWNNLELLHHNLSTRFTKLLAEHWLDTQSLFLLPDTGETLKIETVKNFIASGNVRPRFGFQIFYIENVSRMTPQAQNACLKFFEEPGEGNIIILTNSGKWGILETILSRVQMFPISEFSHDASRSLLEFYRSMIEEYASGNSLGLIEYFFSQKYEKEEYMNFLRALVEYIATTGKYRDLLDWLEEDMQGIMKHNLSARYVVDSYIMAL